MLEKGEVVSRLHSPGKFVLTLGVCFSPARLKNKGRQFTKWTLDLRTHIKQDPWGNTSECVKRKHYHHFCYDPASIYTASLCTLTLTGNNEQRG